jgi:hypothetical protein
MEYLASHLQYNLGYAKPSIAIGTRYEPTDCDRYDYHRQRLMLADLDVSHREMLRYLSHRSAVIYSRENGYEF